MTFEEAEKQDCREIPLWKKADWPRDVALLEECRSWLQLPDGQGDGRHFLCPMRGKRAPELARGAILDLFETIANESRVDLITSCSTPGNPSIRQQCNVTSTLGSQAVINTGLAPGINTQHSTVDDV